MKYLLFALALFFSVPAHAAVTFDAKGTASCSGATSPITCTTLTIGSITNGVLVVLVDYNANAALSASTVTWNGVAATLIGGQYSTAQFAGTALYCLPAPAAGNQTLSTSLTATGLGEIHVIGASFAGANQTTPCKNFTSATDQTATTASLTVTSAVGDIPIAVQEQSDDAVSSVNGTQIVINNSGPNITLSGNYGVGAATVAMTATAGSSVKWQLSGTDIAAAGGGGATLHTRTMTGVGQ